MGDAAVGASGRTLVVVDSQARARTLKHLARAHGADVLACPGPLRRLTACGPGPTFEARWEWDRAQNRQLRVLRAAAEVADRVLLATDPDARGERCAWDLAAALEPRPVRRLRLDALTSEAFAEAVAAAQPLDGRLVEAELTRLVGFRLVTEALASLGAAGAVASWAACLLLQQVAEREARVSAWRPEPGERLRARLRSPAGRTLMAELVGCLRPAQSEAVREALRPAEWRVHGVRSLRSPDPAPPEGVASLVALAERRLRFPSARTLEIARRLYEGKPSGGVSTGLITWHLSPGGPRPTDPSCEPGDAHLAQDEATLYTQILEADRARREPRPARAARVAIAAGDWRFEAHWPSDAGRPAAGGLRRGALLKLEALELIAPEESAPPRLSEAGACQALVELGLAPLEEVPVLLTALEEGGLVSRRGVHLYLTRQGRRLLGRVGGGRPGLLESGPARDFARAVDEVAVGRHGRAAVLAPFARWLRSAKPPETPVRDPAPAPRRRAPGLGLRCPRCARGEIVERRKRGGPLPFYACDRYPECRFTSSALPVAGPCPSCGAPLVRARARLQRTFCVEPGCGWSRRGSAPL